MSCSNKNSKNIKEDVLKLDIVNLLDSIITNPLMARLWGDFSILIFVLFK
jgi:hypothetical protein